MSEDAKVWPFTANVGAGLYLLGRVQAPDGTNAIPANVSKIHIKITRAGLTSPVLSQDLPGAIGDYLSTELRGTASAPDARWVRDCEDDDGFNFDYWISHTLFAVQGHYRVEFTFVDTATPKKQWKVVWEGAARSGDATDHTT